MRYLAGYLLMFSGLGWVVLCLFCAGQKPATPFWVFVCAALVGAVPLMVLGGRLGHRGALAAGASAEEKWAEYRRDTFRFAVYLGWLFLWGFLAALPAFVMGAKLLPWNPKGAFAWYLALIAVRFAARPLYFALDRRAMAWWGRGTTDPVPARRAGPRPCPLKEPVARRVLPRTRAADEAPRVE